MHKLNVKVLGSSSFISTLNELKMFLKFNPLTDNINADYKIILFHIDALRDSKQKNLIYSKTSIKICAGNRKDFNENFDAFRIASLLKEINAIIDDTIAKNKFNKNSSIEIKSYSLNKMKRNYQN